MNEILGIEVPSDLSALSNEDLLGLIGQLRAAAVEAAGGEVDVAKLSEIKAARDFIAAGKVELESRTEREAALAAELEEAMADLEEPETEASDTTPDGGAPAEEEAGEEETDEEDDTDGETEEPVTASAWSPRTRRTAAEIARHAPEPEGSGPQTVALAPLKVVSGVNGRRAGDQFDSMADVGQALLDRWADIAGGGSEKMSVARIDGRFPEESRLGEDTASNIEKMGGLEVHTPKARTAITAAMCAPAEPYYGLVGTSSTARPVAGSLAKYVPARGAVTIYPSPKLGDISNGMGLWTRANDANPAAVKAACSTIACATPVQYDIYGIYRCMTIKNMLQMTYPELVEAYLNRLAALQARLAETTLLDAMVGSVNAKAITVAAGNLGASINLWATLIQMLAVYREQERYDTIELDCYMPRWQREALRMDVVRQRRTDDSGMPRDRVPTGADIDAGFQNVGVNPIWTMDNATAWGSGITAQSAGALNTMPTTAHAFFTPRGNFRQLDRGDLQIGVTNNVMRDNTSLTKNEFTMFWESFEGVMDFGLPSWEVAISGFVLNGAQVADVTPDTDNTP